MAEPLDTATKVSTIDVIFCWSLAARHVQEVKLKVPGGTTVAGVLAWLSEAQGIEPAALESLNFQTPGIWGRKVPWTQAVQAGDRIELYRPLKVDPKVARRQRFKGQGKGRTGLFANRKSGSAAGY